jgi:ribonucleoside-triphosphate reductase
MVTEPVVEEECVCETPAGKQVLLFATKTCPNCKIAGEFLDKAGIAYEKLFADEHLDLVSQYGIKQAPTLVVVEDGLEIAKAANLSNIKKYIETSL